MEQAQKTESNANDGNSVTGPVGYPTGHATPGGLEADNLVKLAAQIGAGWAKYGLTLGRMALTQSARTLESTSELLGALSKKIEKVAGEPADKHDDAPKA
ncbi:MAG: hypothetical protein ACHREM_22345 [Polyangiales bacterium]